MFGLPITLLVRTVFSKLFGASRIVPVLVAHAIALCCLCCVGLYGLDIPDFERFRAIFLRAAQDLWPAQAVFLACDLLVFRLFGQEYGWGRKPLGRQKYRQKL